MICDDQTRPRSEPCSPRAETPCRLFPRHNPAIKGWLQGAIHIGFLTSAFAATCLASEPGEGLASRTAWALMPTPQLAIFQDGDPRAFFFRQSEGYAANPQITYEQWDHTFSRLMGIEGKVLDEEVPGRSRRNIEFFTRFKRRHPDQLILLHYNGNARDPRDQTEDFFAGHWLYWNGARITADVPAEFGESDIHLDNTGLFHVNVGRYQDRNEDIALCLLDEQGRPSWLESEQVQLVSVDSQRGVIRVRRGCYGTKPRAFPAGKAYAAAHVCSGPWGRRSNLLWLYNYSTRCPKDRKGRQCLDIQAAAIADLFSPDGKLALFDGIEFDVLRNQCPGGLSGVRGVDCDADGKADHGIFDGINTYALGVVEFCRKLQDRLGGRKLVLADGGSLSNQRCFGVLNGIESEGWPGLGDWEIKDWSGGLNRHLFWQANARPPVFNYINHKFEKAGEKPGQRVTPEVDFKIHRLVLAAAQLMDAAVCYSYAPPRDDDELIGIWDELWMGKEKRTGWLGKPIGPPVRLALKSPDLLGGIGENQIGDLLPRCESGNVRFNIDGNRLRVSPQHDEQRELSFRLRDVPCQGPDLFVSVTMVGKPLRGYPPEIARLGWVGIAEPRGKLVTQALPYLGMCIRGQKETAALQEAGAVIQFREKLSLAGEKHDCYLVHPPYRTGTGYSFWQRELSVPKDGRLDFFLGMGERASGRSDGVVFKVLLAELKDDGTGQYVKLYEHAQADSHWTHHSVSLSKWEGKRVRLRFVSDCGPNDNATTDHSLWGDVQIVDPAQRAKETEPVRFMTWINDKAFTSGFYYSQVNSPTIDLEFSVEGSEPVWISGLAVHACPDVIYREFQNGLVLANPARHEHTFDMDALFPGQRFCRIHGSPRQDPRTNDGSPVSGRLILQERDGLFLVRTAP
jgi:hypothetical protein